ncbi:hypothetical protein HMPREF0198_1368, partial [Cardiobacterium hominis ATCC 15826]
FSALGVNGFEGVVFSAAATRATGEGNATAPAITRGWVATDLTIIFYRAKGKVDCSFIKSWRVVVYDFSVWIVTFVMSDDTLDFSVNGSGITSAFHIAAIDGILACATNPSSGNLSFVIDVFAVKGQCSACPDFARISDYWTFFYLCQRICIFIIISEGQLVFPPSVCWYPFCGQQKA